MGMSVVGRVGKATAVSVIAGTAGGAELHHLADRCVRLSGFLAELGDGGLGGRQSLQLGVSVAVAEPVDLLAEAERSAVEGGVVGDELERRVAGRVGGRRAGLRERPEGDGGDDHGEAVQAQAC